MILRPPATGRSPFAETHTVDPDRYPAPRHRARAVPLPDSVWVVLTMSSWAMGAAATITSVWVFGPVINPLWLVALAAFGAGVVTFLIGWKRADDARRGRR